MSVFFSMDKFHNEAINTLFVMIPLTFSATIIDILSQKPQLTRGERASQKLCRETSSEWQIQN